ncbi:thiolase family protein [Nocardia xishanensis]
MTPTSATVSGAHIPVGRLVGSLKGFSDSDMGGVAIKAALEKGGTAPGQVEYVITGRALNAGARQAPARKAAEVNTISMDIPAITVNTTCLSGINGIDLAERLIRVGERDIGSLAFPGSGQSC